jgi:phosphate transport system substrate-binding protein
MKASINNNRRPKGDYTMKIFVLAILALLLSSAAALAQNLVIAAGSTATDLVVNPTKVSFEKATGVKIETYKLPSKLGIAKLGANEVQVVITDATLEGILAEIKNGAISFNDPSRLRGFTLLQTSSIVVVHKDNPLSALNKEQLKAIFTGKATEWKAVGGKDAPILVPISDNNKGTIAEFQKKIMDNEAFHREAVHLGTDQEVKDFVASMPEAIGVLSSMAMLDNSLKKVTTPDISKAVSFYTVGEPAGDAKKLLDYLRGDGKKLLKD